MEYSVLGRTGIRVSMLCFGSLTIGPLQRNLSINKGAEVLEEAIENGVNFIDTADIYGTYPYIREVLKRHPNLVIASKSYAYDKKTAHETLERALKGIGRDYIDIFLLHEQEGALTLKGHKEALDFFKKKKEEGVIKGIGISTHYVSGVEAATLVDEIDIIHPILNFRGLGIVDRGLKDMEMAIKRAYEAGKGIYIMKPLGGGHLIRDFNQALRYVLDFPYHHSVAVGMQRKEEVLINVTLFEGSQPAPYLRNSIKEFKRELIIQEWCQGCGKCVQRCPQKAISLSVNSKAVVDTQKCVLCGYCGHVCKELAIKII